MSETVLKKEEQVAFALRSLYKKYGYLPYKMGKFEEYDLYARNKDFLRGDGVITFNDTDGKLLALKPDVTLSIVKNLGDTDSLQKVYYNENVYRVSGETKQFKELMQVGVECIGCVGAYEVYETVVLAAESLAAISDKYVLDISHLGILSALFEEIGLGRAFEKEAVKLLAEKNLHEMKALCLRCEVSAALTEKLLTIVQSYGDMESTLQAIRPLCASGALKTAFDELQSLYVLLKDTEYLSKIRLDFSVVNNMKYYNGIMFKGFIDGVSEGVLSGGRYDGLVARMGKKSGAIGFAVYLDLLADFFAEKRGCDVDVLIIYGEQTPALAIVEQVQKAVGAGNSVRAQKQAGKLRYKTLIDLTKGGSEC